MEFNVNNVGKTLGVGEVSKSAEIMPQEKLNSVFGARQSQNSVNPRFTVEEERIVSMFSKCPVINED